MTRFRRFSAAALTITLAAAALPAAAADRTVKVTLDGRPLDRAGGVAVARAGVTYVDLVDVVKAFDGLLTFQGGAVVVSIGNNRGTFTLGSRTARINDGAVTMRGAAFRRNGDVFVPIDTLVTRVAKAAVAFSPDGSQADIRVAVPSVAAPK